MARGGIFGRITRAVRNIVSPRPAPPPRERPPEPPPERPEPGLYRDIWRSHRHQGSYRKHLSVFNRMMDDVDEHDPSARARLWESYVKHIVGRSHQRRQSPQNMFWRDSGIDPQDFDWRQWRIAMGYTGKRRSRTP